MSNAIELLERLGRDARLRHASAEQLSAALSHAAIDSALRSAIMRKDQQALQLLLGADTNVCCLVYAPEEDESAPPEDESVRVASHREASAA
jgi:hypothetical protein